MVPKGKYACLEVHLSRLDRPLRLPGSPRVAFSLEAMGSDSVSGSEVAERMRN